MLVPGIKCDLSANNLPFFALNVDVFCRADVYGQTFQQGMFCRNDLFPFSKIIHVSVLNICEQVLVDPGLVAKSFSHVASSAGLSYNRAIYED